MAEDIGMPEGMTEEQIDAMEDAAGTAAEEAYTSAIEGGADPSAAASADGCRRSERNPPAAR